MRKQECLSLLTALSVRKDAEMSKITMNSPIQHHIMVAAVAVIAFWQSVNAGAVSVGGKLARDIAEGLAEQAGKKASREFVETTTVQLEKIASKCGNESLDVIEKNGIAAFRVLQSAGDDAGPYLVKAIRAYGDDAVRVAQTAAGRTILRNGSETAVRAVSRHTDAVIPLLRQYGDEGARALSQLSPANGRRLLQMVEEKSLASGDLQLLMRTIGQYGDKAMDFIWRHRKVLTSVTLLAAFVSNPEPYLNGAKQLGEVAAAPLVQFAETAAKSISWNLWVGVALMMCGLGLFLKRRVRMKSENARKESKT